jgi:anhydro-N-acetylmuramic acid kinase
LFPVYDFYLNLGGIANLSFQTKNNFIAFDVCPANSILNQLAITNEKEYDEDGKLAATGSVNTSLLNELNGLDYYQQQFPKSLSNDFGLNVAYPLIQSYKININDALRTYVEHISLQVFHSIKILLKDGGMQNLHAYKLLITGGGAFNKFLIEVLKEKLTTLNIDVLIPDDEVIKYKEALIMALLGVLRWREENTVLASVTGALRNSIGGAVWIGQEA